jgi:hypothetical protein
VCTVQHHGDYYSIGEVADSVGPVEDTKRQVDRHACTIL